MTTSPVMDMLAHGIPITLLCDLATSRDPESMTISLSERPIGDLLADEAPLQPRSAGQRSDSPPSTAQTWPVTYADVASA